MSLQSSSDDCDPHEGLHEGKEGNYRLQVTQFVQRLEYWHKDLTDTLVTSITVAPVHGRAVAYLGTADGRHVQVKASHSSVHLGKKRGAHLHRNSSSWSWTGPEAAAAAGEVSFAQCSCKCDRKPELLDAHSLKLQVIQEGGGLKVL